jgi:ankyrin repeat protein
MSAPTPQRVPSAPNTVSEDDIKSAELVRAMEEEFSQLKDPRRRTALRELFDASDRGDLGSLRKLVPALSSLGILSQQDDDDNLGWTALHYAAYRGRVAVLAYLLECKFPVDAVDKTMRTALHSALASASVRMEGVEYLVRNGASVEAKDKTDWTPLHIAVFRGHVEAVRYLVDKGANVEAVCSLGSAVELAAGMKEMVAVLERGKGKSGVK